MLKKLIIFLLLPLAANSADVDDYLSLSRSLYILSGFTNIKDAKINTGDLIKQIQDINKKLDNLFIEGKTAVSKKDEKSLENIKKQTEELKKSITKLENQIKNPEDIKGFIKEIDKAKLFLKNIKDLKFETKEVEAFGDLKFEYISSVAERKTLDEKQKEAKKFIAKLLKNIKAGKKVSQLNIKAIKDIFRGFDNPSFPGDREKRRLGLLELDPLLITTAIEILNALKLAKSETYQLIKDVFKDQIDFIEEELKLLTHNTTPPEGLRNDLDKAVNYNDKIQIEVETAKKNDDIESKNFVQDIEALQKRLVGLLETKKGIILEWNKKAPKEKQIDVEKIIEKLKIYLPVHTQTISTCVENPQYPYRSIYTQLIDATSFIRDILNSEAQNKEIINRKEVVQAFTGQLKNVYTFLTQNPCCKCHRNDMRDFIKQNPNNYKEVISNEFKLIENFLSTEKNIDEQTREISKKNLYNIQRLMLELLEKAANEPSKDIHGQTTFDFDKFIEELLKQNKS